MRNLNYPILVTSILQQVGGGGSSSHAAATVKNYFPRSGIIRIILMKAPPNPRKYQGNVSVQNSLFALLQLFPSDTGQRRVRIFLRKYQYQITELPCLVCSNIVIKYTRLTFSTLLKHFVVKQLQSSKVDRSILRFVCTPFLEVYSLPVSMNRYIDARIRLMNAPAAIVQSKILTKTDWSDLQRKFLTTVLPSP